MNYKVGDDVTNGFSTGTIIAINENQRQVRWEDGTKTWEGEGLMLVHNCEDCRYGRVRLDEEPCASCNVGYDNNWEAVIGTAKAAQHYIDSAMQPIEVAQRLLTPEQFIGALKFNEIKYRMRCDHKGQHDSDIAKALQYAYWADLAQQGHRIDPTVDVPPQDYEWKGI